MPEIIRIRNLSRPDQLSIRARYCDSFLCRFLGLMFRERLPEGEGLLLVQAKDSTIDSSIHMLFMRMDLAVFWIDSKFQVVDTILARRWRLPYFSKYAARYVLEMGSENLDILQIGDRLVFENEHDS